MQAHNMSPAADRHATTGYFDRLAPVYGEGTFFAARRAAVLAVIRAEAAGAGAVCDLGCGNGAFLVELAAGTPAPHVVGVDLSREMLAAARRRVPAARLVEADAAALPFAAHRFDLVFMSHVLQLVAEVAACVSDVARCLAPGGHLIATVGTTGWRDLLARFAPEDAQEFAAVIGSVRRRSEPDEQARVDAAARDAGLQPTWQRVPFTATWPALEEWFRLRWLTVLDEPRRTAAAQWLERLRPRAAGLTLELAENLLIARQPR
jgi:ubiquinone/menaquinone biosynthesis C-methylase UbiE